MKIELDPRNYKIEQASLDERTIIDMSYPELLRSGRVLDKIDALPFMEEPKGSGNFSTTGNFSVKVARGFLITGSGTDKVNLEKENLVYVENIDYYSGILFASGNVRPSREVLIHDQIYRTNPNVGAVIHTHDKTALKYGRSIKTREPIFFANLREAEEVASALSFDNYVTLPMHGQFVTGRDINEALELAVEKHRVAVMRTPIGIVAKFGFVSLVAATMLAIPASLIAEHYHFRDCERREVLGSGTRTYTCPAQVSCGDLKYWEGESERISEGKRECTFSTLVGSS